MAANESTTSEVWRDIPEFSGYQASSLGQIKSFKGIEPRILAPNTNSRGYLKVRITHDSGKIVTRTVHELVLSAFVGPRPTGLMGRHLDGNQKNNKSDNLLWGTCQDNLHDAVGHGTRVKVFFPEQVVEVIAMDAKGMLRSEIADHFGVARSAITKVLIRNGMPSTRPYRPPAILSEDDIALAARLAKKGISQAEIAKELGVSLSTIKRWCTAWRIS